MLINAVITLSAEQLTKSIGYNCMLQENILFIFSVASLKFEYTFNTRGNEALGYIMD